MLAAGVAAPAIMGNIVEISPLLTNSCQNLLSTSFNDRGTCMAVDPSNMQDEHGLAIGAAGSLPNLLHMTRGMLVGKAHLFINLMTRTKISNKNTINICQVMSLLNSQPLLSQVFRFLHLD